MPTTIFYAWQSDRDQKVCHYFIRDCANAAIDAIKAELESERPSVEEAPPLEGEVKLDHDTKDVPGSPHIAETIKQKIDAADAFIADLTCVRQYVTADGRKKRAQNANVLIELGLALRLKGSERILLVMNRAFGSPKNLPFDLRHYRHPITYQLKDASEKAAFADAKKELTGKLKTALKVMLTHIAANTTQTETATGHARANERWKGFVDRFKAGKFYGLETSRVQVIDEDHPYQSETTAHAGIGIIPLKAVKLDIGAIEKLNPQSFYPMGESGWNTEPFGGAVVFHDGSSRRSGRNQSPMTVTEVNEDGCVVAATDMYVRPDYNGSYRSTVFQNIEVKMLSAAARYLKQLRDLGVNGPMEFRFVLPNIGRTYLLPNRYEYYDQRQFRPLEAYGPIESEPINLKMGRDDADLQSLASAVRPAFERLWRDAGFTRDPCFDDAGKFSQRLA